MQIKKCIYKWHRTLSILIAFPVLFWAMSGFLHPVMTTIRPHIQTQSAPNNQIDTAELKIPIYQVLQQNHIDSIYNFRIVKFNNTEYYQIFSDANTTPSYYSAVTGAALKNGDIIYAKVLAQHFLNDSIASTVSPIISTQEITHFDGEYKSVNQLLPVCKVSFQRPDGIRIYVDTRQSRFSYAEDNKRAVFNQLFSFFIPGHGWTILEI